MKTIHQIMNVAVLAVFILLSSGCRTYMKFRYGMTQPKEETPEKLISFLTRNHYPTGNQFLFSDSSIFDRMTGNTWFLKHLLSHMIFDRQGTLLKDDTTKCQWAGFDKIRSLSPDSVYERSGALQVDQILPNIRPFGPNPGKGDSIDDPDFTIIVTWAKFLGKYNYRLFDLNDAVKQNTTARIRLIWLNVDMQKCWNLTRGQKMRIR